MTAVIGKGYSSSPQMSSNPTTEEEPASPVHVSKPDSFENFPGQRSEEQIAISTVNNVIKAAKAAHSVRTSSYNAFRSISATKEQTLLAQLGPTSNPERNCQEVFGSFLSQYSSFLEVEGSYNQG